MAIKEKQSLAIANSIHLGGDLYKVPLNLIGTTSTVLKNGEISFINPRHAANKKVEKKSSVHGFNDIEISELQEAIRSEGLEHPLLARYLPDGSLQLVAGERRLHCLRNLLSKNILCFDPISEEEKPASEVYALVECRVRVMDDQTAFKMAFSENESSVPIGESATLSLVAYFRDCGYDDKTIMHITGHGVSWLRETDSLLQLDNITREAFLSNDINRATALKLSKIEDENQRTKLLEGVKKAALERIRLIQEAAEARLDQVREQEANVRDLVVDATHRGDNDAMSAAESKLLQIKERVADREEDYKKVLQKKTATTKDLNKAAKKIRLNDGEIIKSLSKSKMEKSWLVPVVEAIKNKFKDAEGNDMDINSEDAYLTKLLCESFMEGQSDIWKILRQHEKNKQRRMSK